MAATRLKTELTDPVFLVALGMLLLNDFWLKSAYPGLITGKLSDFAGLYVFAAIGRALFPRHTGWVLMGTCLAFTFWKSSLSQPVIEGLNAWMPFAMGRTVDYWDLTALIVLPVVHFRRIRWSRFGLTPAPGWLAMPILAVAIFAMAATTQVPIMSDALRVVQIERMTDYVFTTSELAPLMERLKRLTGVIPKKDELPAGSNLRISRAEGVG
ncbi:MAG: hypothetical protein V3S64_08760, partial [bacterium]